MTQEDKELLFIDLCARLPYYPYALFDLDKKFDEGFQAPIIGMVNKGNTGVIKYNQEFYAYGCMTPFNIEELRIYLRPMSSMTKEERKYFQKLAFPYDFVDALNANYFDYRGFIEKGLALEAPEGMYNIKEK